MPFQKASRYDKTHTLVLFDKNLTKWCEHPQVYII